MWGGRASEPVLSSVPEVWGHWHPGRPPCSSCTCASISEPPPPLPPLPQRVCVSAKQMFFTARNYLSQCEETPEHVGKIESQVTQVQSHTWRHTPPVSSVERVLPHTLHTAWRGFPFTPKNKKSMPGTCHLGAKGKS